MKGILAMPEISSMQNASREEAFMVSNALHCTALYLRHDPEAEDSLGSTASAKSITKVLGMQTKQACMMGFTLQACPLQHDSKLCMEAALLQRILQLPL